MKISHLVFVCLFIILVCTSVQALSFTDLTPFLIDLQGWDAEDATGMTISGPSGEMVTATREYELGDKVLHAQIITGATANGAWAPFMAGYSIDSAEVFLTTMTVSGYTVGVNHDKAGNSGVVVVPLTKKTTHAVFALAYEGIGYEEALSLAQTFPWKDMEKVLE
ncbi:MAG: hypothetical protein ACP5G0_12935 [Desulfomonilia bacterium]